MTKLNQTEIKSLARQIVRRVNDEVIKHNNSLKTSKEYEKFKKDFPKTGEGKDVQNVVDAILEFEKDIKDINLLIEKKKLYLEDRYNITILYRPGHSARNIEEAMGLVAANAQKGKFKEKRVLMDNMHSNYISEDMAQLMDKLTIDQVEGSNLKDSMNNLVKEIFKTL